MYRITKSKNKNESLLTKIKSQTKTLQTSKGRLLYENNHELLNKISIKEHCSTKSLELLRSKLLIFIDE